MGVTFGLIISTPGSISISALVGSLYVAATVGATYIAATEGATFMLAATKGAVLIRAATKGATLIRVTYHRAIMARSIMGTLQHTSLVHLHGVREMLIRDSTYPRGGCIL